MLTITPHQVPFMRGTSIVDDHGVDLGSHEAHVAAGYIVAVCQKNNEWRAVHYTEIVEKYNHDLDRERQVWAPFRAYQRKRRTMLNWSWCTFGTAWIFFSLFDLWPDEPEEGDFSAPFQTDVTDGLNRLVSAGYLTYGEGGNTLLLQVTPKFLRELGNTLN